MRFLIILHIALIVLLSCNIYATETQDDRFYIQSGFLAGYETSGPHYNVQDCRFFVDLGYERIDYPIRTLKYLERIGISWNMSFGLWEVRHGIGPKLTWKLNDSWSLQTMAGPVFSEPNNNYEMGFHTNNALVFRDKVSLNILYETLPPSTEFQKFNGERVHSVYGGIVVHGKPGGYLALSVAVIFVAISIAFSIALADGLGQLG